MSEEVILQKANELRKRFEALDKYDVETTAQIWVIFSQKFYGETWVVPDYTRILSAIAYYEKIIIPKRKMKQDENKTKKI